MISKRRAKERAWEWVDAQPDLPHGALYVVPKRSEYENEGFRRIAVVWNHPNGSTITLASLLISDENIVINKDKRRTVGTSG